MLLLFNPNRVVVKNARMPQRATVVAPLDLKTPLRTVTNIHTLSQLAHHPIVATSETQEIKKLLTDLQLGDEKPSHLLRKMKELSNGQLRMIFLQSLVAQRMPTTYPDCLYLHPQSLWMKLAIIADKVSEVVGSSSTICAATTVPPPSQSHLHAVFSQPWTLSPGRSKSCLYKLLN
ncbi:hypothetical protein TNCV_2988201 [Trichonephila clavipes]|nr:hypothetical protein TNCV_2988201 [Trichonephila clavipes]